MYLAIDGTHWIHQLWHVQKAHVLSGCINRLRALLDYVQPTLAVACFDCRSFRHDLLPAYKAHRPDHAAELQDALDRAPEEFGKLVPIAAQDGFEADDCLATAAALGREAGRQVVLASPDKDLRQCLSAGEVTILRKFSTDQGRFVYPEWYTAETLHEGYGLTPEQWPDYQALCGDHGDGIPGCPGWGEKTTLKVLSRFHTLQNVLANPLALPVTDKQRLALSAFRTQADLMVRLVTLRRDVEAVSSLIEFFHEDANRFASTS